MFTQLLILEKKSFLHGLISLAAKQFSLKAGPICCCLLVIFMKTVYDLRFKLEQIKRIDACGFVIIDK